MMPEVEVKRLGAKKAQAAGPLRTQPTLRSVNDPLQAQQRRARLRAAVVMTGLLLGMGLIGTSMYLLVFDRSEVRIPTAGSVPTLAEGPVPASLSFVVEPVQADILLNGRRVEGAQDASRQLDPGSYLVSVRAEGYARLDSLVQLRSNSAFVFVVSLDRLEPAGGIDLTGDPAVVDEEVPTPQPITPVAGDLQISANVDGARVLIDGRLAGRTPLSVSLAPGDYQLRLEADGFRPVSQSVNVSERATAEVSASLVQETGRVRVLVLPWGSIFVDGALYAEGSDIRHTVELPVGRHVIRSEHPVLGTLERAVVVRADQTLDVVLEYSP